jgi:hypothetical protein
LRELDLGGNEVGDAGAAALARALAAPRAASAGPGGLVALRLASSLVGDAGAEALAAAVRSLAPALLFSF